AAEIGPRREVALDVAPGQEPGDPDRRTEEVVGYGRDANRRRVESAAGEERAQSQREHRARHDRHGVSTAGAVSLRAPSSHRVPPGHRTAGNVLQPPTQADAVLGNREALVP